MLARALALGIVGSLSVGCVAEENAAPYALYSASGTLTDSCGGTGVLAAPEDVTMRVSIRLVGASAIHWDHGDGIMMGVLDHTGSFSVSRYMRVDMYPGENGQPGCAVERQIVVDGILNGNPDQKGTYDGFDATMRNDYRAFDSATCGDLLEGEEPIAETLPCTISYDVDGERD